jgi:tripartite-type tricarboxylate transporter receptor subunit TctC
MPLKLPYLRFPTSRLPSSGAPDLRGVKLENDLDSTGRRICACRRRSGASALAIAFSVLLVSFGAEGAEEPAAFFDGRTITYIVSTDPGGGYDTYGRLLARHLQKYIPGSRIIVRNVPGAGQIIGANTINASRPDGLTFGIFNTGMISGQLLGAEGIRFDLSEMSWIGSLASEGRALAVSTRSGIRNIRDMQTSDTEILMASAGLGSSSYVETKILKSALGLNVRIISGMLGGDTELSMLRGEISGTLNAASSHDEFVARGDGIYVLSISGGESPIPGVPEAREVVSDQRALRLLNLVETVGELGRLTVGPPNIPAERLEFLRQAFLQAAADPELLSQAAMINIPISPVDGAEVEQKMRAALDQPPELVAELKSVVEEE